jgi:ubiquinone/menaquinone biosynthesis C-methylase UbiE
MKNMPKPNKDGRINTLNDMGAMTPELDPITTKFLEFINVTNKAEVISLEIGAAYGNVALAALKISKVKYVANDIDPRHLEILKERVDECCANNTNNLSLIAGDFPEIDFDNQLFDAILIARVLHFFSPQKMIKSIEKLYELLSPNGCVYVIGISPYVKRFASFIPEYEKLLKTGVAWPGYVESLQEYADPVVTGKELYDKLKNKPFNFFSANLLKAQFKFYGFEVIEANEYSLSYKSAEWELDGRENVGIIACKAMDFQVPISGLNIEQFYEA